MDLNVPEVDADIELDAYMEVVSDWPEIPKGMVLPWPKRRHLRTEEILWIVECKLRGIPEAAILRATGISKSTINRIVNSY